MKVALCFWGLCRSTHYTVTSIQRNIFQALRSQGIAYDVFVHSYRLFRPYTNTRTGEINVQLRNTNWKLLEPLHATIENQDIIDTQLQLAKYRTQGDPWREDENYSPFQTLDNHIRALWSLHQVTFLWEMCEEPYDFVIYLRPDVEYIQPIQLEWFELATHNTIVIPAFHNFFGSNDRFALCRPNVARVYGHRFQEAYSYSKTKQLHSEAFLTDCMIRANISFVRVPFVFRRIRANGQLCDADKELTART